MQTWNEFVAYFEKMRGFRIVESMKDFYWDVQCMENWDHINDVARCQSGEWMGWMIAPA